MEVIFDGKKEHELALEDGATIKQAIEECRSKLLKGDETLFVMNGTV